MLGNRRLRHRQMVAALAICFRIEPPRGKDMEVTQLQAPADPVLPVGLAWSHHRFFPIGVVEYPASAWGKVSLHLTRRVERIERRRHCRACVLARLSKQLRLGPGYGRHEGRGSWGRPSGADTSRKWTWHGGGVDVVRPREPRCGRSSRGQVQPRSLLAPQEECTGDWGYQRRFVRSGYLRTTARTCHPRRA